jgi:hypothetical protein
MGTDSNEIGEIDTAQGKATDSEVVARVTAALLAGMGAAEAARGFKLPRLTVYRIAEKIGPNFKQLDTVRQARIGDLLADLIEINTAGLKAIALQATDAE